FAPREHRRIGRSGIFGFEWRTLLGVILGHLAQVGVWQVGHQVVHWRVMPSTIAKGDELVVEIACRFRGDPGKRATRSALPALAVARHAALNARLDGVDALERRDR